MTDPEPLPADDPLLEAPNLLVVPHIGSATHRTRERMAEFPFTIEVVNRFRPKSEIRQVLKRTTTGGVDSTGTDTLPPTTTPLATTTTGEDTSTGTPPA